MTRWMAGGRWIEPGHRPLVMGILNVTPDSFSDGGKFKDLDAAVTHAHQLVSAGADLLDIGGESSRPGSRPILVDAELMRVIPLIQAIQAEIPIPISLDTSKPKVAAAAIQAGVAIINDIRGMTDPSMIEVVNASQVGVVVMHMQGEPISMQVTPKYDDVVAEVFEFLQDRVETLIGQGVERHRIAVDPGIGFGKSLDHNRQLLRHLDRFAALGCPVLVGTSRKGFLGQITGQPIADRLNASIVSALACAVGGASIVRVHDVAATREALAVWEFQRGW